MAISKVVFKSSPTATPVTWIDATPSTAGAAQISSGYTAMLANGVVTEGTGSGGGITEADKKAVNFYDYDGFRLYSYTAAEAQALEALPSNPSHTGLTAQGWNWTLAEIKSQLTNVGGIVNVGQNYVTSDGKTYIDIELDDPNYLHPYFVVAVNGAIVIDWGDNSSTSSLTGSSDSSVVYTDHIYSSVGKYTIAVTVSSGKFTFRTGGYMGFLHISGSSYYWNATTYARTIKSIRLGNSALIGQYAFNYCMNMESITIPSTITDIGTYAFARCSLLKICVIPSGITTLNNAVFRLSSGCFTISVPSTLTSIGEYAFENCRQMSEITIPASVSSIGKNAYNNLYNVPYFNIPNNVQIINPSTFYMPVSMRYLSLPSNLTTIGAEAFYASYSLETLTIPASVTSIGSKAFYGAYTFKEIHFLGSTPPSLASSDVFSSLRNTCTIYVPTGYLSAYTSASNYPSSATYTYVEE